ncbi:hypothetical protein HPB50_028195 [Hyalomma asiaticum]|nr:hypothetical protein HPB50_028195 [Hyalomma asiaticum]
MSLDDLTDLERELLRRSDALNVVPYDGTPLQEDIAPSSSTRGEDDPGDPDPTPPEDVGWCRCGRCRPMPTVPERLCCRDLHQCVQRNARCICEDEYFYTLCLDMEVLSVAYCELRERGEEPVLDIHRKYRYTAYRQFTRWIWGRLGPRNREVIPSCAVWMIRKMFPSPQYHGFKYPDL